MRVRNPDGRGWTYIGPSKDWRYKQWIEAGGVPEYRELAFDEIVSIPIVEYKPVGVRRKVKRNTQTSE